MQLILLLLVAMVGFVRDSICLLLRFGNGGLEKQQSLDLCPARFRMVLSNVQPIVL